MKIQLYALIVAVSVLCLSACIPEDVSQSNSASAETLDDQSVSTFSDDITSAIDEDTSQENSTALSDASLNADSISQEVVEDDVSNTTVENRLIPQRNAKSSSQYTLVPQK